MRDHEMQADAGGGEWAGSDGERAGGGGLSALAQVCSWLTPELGALDGLGAVDGLLPAMPGALGGGAYKAGLTDAPPSGVVAGGAVLCFSREDLFDDRVWLHNDVVRRAAPRPEVRVRTHPAGAYGFAPAAGPVRPKPRQRPPPTPRDPAAFAAAQALLASRETKPAPDPSIQNKRYMKDDIPYFKFYHQPTGQAVREFDVRCDWSSVDVDGLDPEFRAAYAYYPKANCPREEYRGTRWKFESEFNALLFAFLHLNPELRDAGRYVHEKLIEAYRNDIPELQSRRARKRIVGRAPRESRSSAARRAAAAAENESASVGNSGSASSDESSESASLSPPSTETMA